MTRRKLGRNDRCWCGSGKKYKHCHWDRESQTPLDVWDVSKTFNKAFSKKICLAPDTWREDCDGKISQSHTVPRSGSLRLIARDGHVYSFVPRLGTRRNLKGKITPQLLGIKLASTFTGFCSKHDNSIFQPLEKKTFTGTQEQCFLLGYRALAREIYTKTAASSPELSAIRHYMDRGRAPTEQRMLQTLNRDYEVGLSAGLKDMSHCKQRYDGILKTQQFDTVRGYVIEFENPPPVMCSFALTPDQDFNGIQLQNMFDLSRIADLLPVTSFYGGDCGIVAFSWLAENDSTCRPFIESLKAVPDKRVTAALLRLFFTYSENLHIDPEWWEGLPEELGTRSSNVLCRRLTSQKACQRLLMMGYLSPHGKLPNDSKSMRGAAFFNTSHLQNSVGLPSERL